MKKIALVIAVTLLVQGCSVLTVEKQHREIRADQKEVERIVEEATRFRDVKPRAHKIEIERGKEWLYNELSANTSGLGMREAIQSLAQGYPVIYNTEPTYNPPIMSSRNSRTVKDHLDSIELQANVGIVVEKGGVIVSSTKTVQYEIPFFGSDAESTQGIVQIQLSADNLQRSVSSGGAGDFRNAVIGNLNPYKDISEMVQSTIPSVAPCQDQTAQFETINEKRFLNCFAVANTGNSLTLTARPHDHLRFKRVFDKWVSNATRQANITIKTYEIDVTRLAQQQVDINLVRNSLIQTSLSNQTGDLINIRDGGGILNIEFNDPTLYIGGTTAVLKALERISDVSVIDSYEAQLHNNRLHTDRNFGTVRYLEQLSRQEINQGGTTLSTPVAQFKEISTGLALNILPTITENAINMHIVLNTAEVDRFDTINVGDGLLTATLPQDSGSDKVFDVTLKSNEMVMLTSSLRKVVRVEKGKNDALPIIGDSRNGEKRIIQRIHLIQGQIVGG